MKPTAALLLLLAGCTASLAAPAPSVSEPASAVTRWVAARAPRDGVLLEAPARVLASPQSQSALSPPLRARVVTVRVIAGQTVKAGEPLIEVVMPEAVQAAGAWLAAQLRLDAHRSRLEHLGVLKAEGLARRAEVADTEVKIAEARADAQAARATLRSAGLDERAAEALLAGSGAVTLKSAVAGVVTRVDARPGETREPTGEPLLEITGAGAVQIEARLPSAPPAGARFVWRGAHGATPLELRSLAPRIDARDGTQLAWLSAADPSGLTGGATGRLRVLAGDEVAGALVPARAVVVSGERTVAAVRRANATHAVDVTVRASLGADVWVDGVSPGEEVAADAALALEEPPR